MTPMEIGPGPGYNPQSLLSAASAALAQPLAASSAAGLPPSPPRAGPGGEGLATAASSAGGLGHGGGGGARITLSPYTAGSALLAGQPHPQPHPVSAGGAASAARDAHPLPPPLGLGGVGRAGDGTGVLQLRISGGLSPMPTHTHAYGHSSKAPAGFDAAAAAALASPSPPAQQVGHMVAQGVAPPQGPSPMRLTTSGAYAGGPGGVGAGTGGAVLRHNTSGGSGGSASIRVASAGSVASGSTTRSGYVSGQVTGAGGARDAAPAREPSAFGKKVSEAAAAAAAVAAAAGGSTGGGGGMGAVERLAALKLQVRANLGCVAAQCFFCASSSCSSVVCFVHLCLAVPIITPASPVLVTSSVLKCLYPRCSYVPMCAWCVCSRTCAAAPVPAARVRTAHTAFQAWTGRGRGNRTPAQAPAPSTPAPAAAAVEAPGAAG